MSPPRFVRDTASFALSQYVSRIVQLARGVIAARVLGPSLYGSWNALMLVLDYGILSHLGIQQGLDQEIPGSIAHDPKEKSDRLKRGGLSGVLVLWLVFAVGVAVYVLVRPRRLEVAWGAAGVMVMVLSVILQLILFYHQTLLRSHSRIGAVSVSLTIQAIVGGLAGLALVFPMGVWGLLVGWLAGQLAALGYVRVAGRDVAPLRFELNEGTRFLFVRGFPIFLFMAAGTVLKTVDRVLILKFLSTEALGYYSVGLMGLSLLLYIPESISYVLYPRLIARYRATSDPDATADMLAKPLATVAWVMPLLVGVAFFWVDPLVRLLLPKYLPGVPSLAILLFGAVGLSIASLPSYYIMAIGRQTRLVPVSILAIVLDVTLVLAFLNAGWKLEGVALGVSLGYLLYGVSLLVYAAMHLSGGTARRVHFVTRALLPGVLAAGLCAVLALGVGRFVPSNLFLLDSTLILSTLFVVLYLLTARWMSPGTGIAALLRESNLPVARLLAWVWTRD